MIPRIKIPAGIGDALWVLQTLPQQLYDVEVQGSVIGGKNVDRAAQLKEVLPSLINSIKVGNHKYPHGCTHQVNTHLEAGKRIENYSGKITWELPFETSNYKQGVSNMMGDLMEQYHFVIYTSSTKSVNNWKGWNANKWKEFIQLLRTAYSCQLYVIGAEYDDICNELKGYENVNVLQNKPLGYIIELFKNCHALFGFASGMPILSTMVGTPTMMFYPHNRKDLFPNLANAWVKKTHLISEFHKPMIWDRPKNIFDWIERKSWIERNN